MVGIAGTFEKSGFLLATYIARLIDVPLFDPLD